MIDGFRVRILYGVDFVDNFALNQFVIPRVKVYTEYR